MYPLGHLSTSYVLASSMKLNVGVCVVAGLFPDLFDKTAKYAFHVFPHGRVIAHSLLGMLVISLAIFLIKGKHWSASWFVGHLGHLLGDFFGDVLTPGPPFVPWLFPFQTYEWPDGKMFFSPLLLMIELCITALAVRVFYCKRVKSLKAKSAI